MKNTTRLMLAAAALCTAGLFGTAPASAASHVGFSFRVGDVAMAYNDGYYDRYNRWHRWHSMRDRDWYRVNYHHRYRGWRHDRDRDGIPNRFDRDRDNDGVPNWRDRHPNNPYRD